MLISFPTTEKWILCECSKDTHYLSNPLPKSFLDFEREAFEKPGTNFRHPNRQGNGME